MINISFFSYKGGAGRTSLLYNTLPFLAEELNATENEPIIVLDLDLDSQGLTYLTETRSTINTIQVLKSENCLGFRDGGLMKEHPFFKQSKAIGKKVGLDSSKDKSILFVSAQPVPGAESLSEDGNYDGTNVSLSSINRLCRLYNCKALIMDTPSGTQLPGKAALAISNKIVTVMRITKQFRTGTAEFLREKTKGELKDKEFVIVPNAVPPTAGTNYRSTEKPEKLNLTFLTNGNKGINEVNLFKFEEESLKSEEGYRELKNDEQNAVKMYKLLAKELAKEIKNES